MTQLLCTPGCPKTRRIRSWLKDRMIACEEINLNVLLLEKDKLISFLSKTDPKQYCDIRGHEDLFEKGREADLADWLQSSPSRIRKPVLILDEDFLSNSWLCAQLEESLRSAGFLACPKSCPVYHLCAASRDSQNFAIVPAGHTKTVMIEI